MLAAYLWGFSMVLFVPNKTALNTRAVELPQGNRAILHSLFFTHSTDVNKSPQAIHDFISADESPVFFASILGYSGRDKVDQIMKNWKGGSHKRICYRLKY